MELSQNHFGFLDGKEVTQYTIKNDHGMKVSFINYGCIVTEISVPDANGLFENVVLGFDNLEDYLNFSPFFGAICGRVAGRIGRAEFELNGKTYQLAKNDGENHLHGGRVGFDKVIWNAEIEDSSTVKFSRTSLSGEEGYPGNLAMDVTYSLTNENELNITYHGVSDEDTIVNVTNHSYFNLSGDLKTDILDHELQLKSDKFIELGNDLIPTGEVLPVENTPFDFRNGRKIRDGVNSEFHQNVLVGNGYDHPFLLNEHHQKEIILRDLSSGRELIIETDEPCVVFYSGNMLQDHYQINGIQSKKHLGLCLETQGPPDAIHHPNFSTSILKKGETYSRSTRYTFSTIK
ncbi:galactose mutarotase [Anaerobacillus sp. CMMVII]|uniref:aldose epimerase family protein n=1 Tax=Anaerobacillus sp. CMMVII TaxID=2755588 RepID=UPI0021B81754|nr:aldose epimerase family protein [Anaerobacillus sp. CMMVII]MCT8137120.1 galactose mutarotase [Anaerobacillus sp. CMMVII]